MKFLNLRILFVLLLWIVRVNSIYSQAAVNYITPSGHFKIYYYNSGANTVDLTDNDNNTIPDYVDHTGDYLENAYSKYINTYGFLKPPLDTSGYYHIILVNMATIGYPPNILGATFKRDTMGMDNPNSTTVTETNASRSFIVLRSSYFNTDPNFTEDEMLEINATHEFFHVVQHGYNFRLSGFFNESTATFYTDLVCTTGYGLKTFLYKFYLHPDFSLNYDHADDPNTQHNYASWIFWEFMHEHISTDIIKLFLEKSISSLTKTDELTVLQLILVGKGTSLNAVFTDFCIANVVFSKDAAAYPKYFYKDLNKYINEGLFGNNFEAPFFYNGTPIIYKSKDLNKRLMRLSTDNFYINASTKKFSVKCRPEISGADIEVILTKRRLSDKIIEIEKLPYRTLNGNKEFWTNIDNPAEYESYQVMIKRYDRNVTDTSSLQYEIEVGLPDPWTVFDITPFSKSGYNSAADIDLDPANGDLWVTTGAILRYNGRWSTVRDPSPFGGAWRGWAKVNGKNWFGYENSGFSKYDGTFTDYTFNTDTNITTYVSEIVASGTTLWKAGDQVVRYDGSSFKKFGTSDGLGSTNISDIAVSPADGSIWVGSDAGVGRFSSGIWGWYTTTSGLPNNVIWGIDVSKTGVVWVGMPNGKIAKSTGKGFVEVVNPDIPTGCSIPCIVDDIKLTPSENVWVGMRSNGASFYDGTTWKNYNPVNTGIAEMNGVHKIAVDGDSCVWFAMDSKISRYCYKKAASGINKSVVSSAHVLSLFPNPASFDVSVQNSDDIRSVVFYNSNGKEMKKTIKDFQHISLEGFTDGIYFVKLNNTNGYSELKKLIVSHPME